MASKYTNRNLMEYDFDENDYANLVTSKQQMTAADNAVKNYGDPKYARQQDLENAINAGLNLGKFSYDINGDALYQQYKDNYITQGKQAMMDTMGQAAAMTGGYGNSYAATVGNQTYQGYLQNLNNMIPQLQQMALDRYNAESNRLSENISILNADKANYLTEWELGYNKRVGEREYAATNYHELYDNTLDNYNNQITANNDAYWKDREANALEDISSYEDTISKLKSDIENNYISIDRFKTDADGNIIGIDENTWENYKKSDNNEDQEDENKAIAYGGITVSEGKGKREDFDTERDGYDNFDVKVNGKKYRVENQGKVTVTNTIKALDKSEAQAGNIVKYGGKLYYKSSDGAYYNLGATNVLFWKTSGYEDLLKALE